MIRFQKCKFQAALCAVSREADVGHALQAVLSDKKVSKASHPHMYAWRAEGGGGGASGYHDSGESGSGKRLLKLLEDQGLANHLVAVTRWYGGAHLGNARFRVIVKTARDLITEERDA